MRARRLLLVLLGTATLVGAHAVQTAELGLVALRAAEAQEAADVADPAAGDAPAALPATAPDDAAPDNAAPPGPGAAAAPAPRQRAVVIGNRIVLKGREAPPSTASAAPETVIGNRIVLEGHEAPPSPASAAPEAEANPGAEAEKNPGAEGAPAGAVPEAAEQAGVAPATPEQAGAVPQGEEAEAGAPAAGQPPAGRRASAEAAAASEAVRESAAGTGGAAAGAIPGPAAVSEADVVTESDVAIDRGTTDARTALSAGDVGPGEMAPGIDADSEAISEAPREAEAVSDSAAARAVEAPVESGDAAASTAGVALQFGANAEAAGDAGAEAAAAAAELPQVMEAPELPTDQLIESQPATAPAATPAEQQQARAAAEERALRMQEMAGVVNQLGSNQQVLDERTGDIENEVDAIGDRGAALEQARVARIAAYGQAASQVEQVFTFLASGEDTGADAAFQQLAGTMEALSRNAFQTAGEEEATEAAAAQEAITSGRGALARADLYGARVYLGAALASIRIAQRVAQSSPEPLFRE